MLLLLFPRSNEDRDVYYVSRPLNCVIVFQVQDPVNIKLSDYGISRQTFREGALGVEGTPGYQAPEIRPGIVYDEKVRSPSYWAPRILRTVPPIYTVHLFL